MGRMDGSLCFHPAGLRSSGQQSWHMLAVTVAVLVGLCQRATAQVFTRDMGSLMDKCPSAWSFTANSPCAYFGKQGRFRQGRCSSALARLHKGPAIARSPHSCNKT